MKQEGEPSYSPGRKMTRDKRDKIIIITEETNCPLCKGKGRLKAPRGKHGKRIINNSIMAKLLRDRGYSLREIGAFLGYKSPRSVELCLERYEKHYKDGQTT